MSTPTLPELRRLTVEYVQALQRWLELPGRLFREGVAAKRTNRDGMCALVERSWHKLKQDMSGTLNLIASSHLGPAAALMRICREQALWMFRWAFSDAKEDAKLRHYHYDVRQKKNAKRLKRDVEAFLNLNGLVVDPRTRARLEDARNTADLILAEPDVVANQGTVDDGDFSFARLARIAAGLLAASDLSADVVAGQVIDYWLECEAVHGGPNAFALYQPEDFNLDLDRNGELTGLARLKDLYLLTILVNGAILQVMAMAGQLERPQESLELAAVADKVQLVVVAASK